MTSRMWDRQENGPEIPMLSEDNKTNLIISITIILTIAIIFIGTLCLRERTNKNSREMHNMGWARTPIYNDGRWSETEWIKGNGMPIVIERISNHDSSINFLRNELKESQ